MGWGREGDTVKGGELDQGGEGLEFRGEGREGGQPVGGSSM